MMADMACRLTEAYLRACLDCNSNLTSSKEPVMILHRIIYCKT